MDKFNKQVGVRCGLGFKFKKYVFNILFARGAVGVRLHYLVILPKMLYNHWRHRIGAWSTVYHPQK